METYRARLFRGWEMVRLEYVLEGGRIAVRRKGTWSAGTEEVVRVSELTGEVRRVWGRQPAFVASTVVAVVGLLVLGIDAMVHGVGAGQGLASINWALWGPVLAVVAVAGVVRTKTRRAAEWSHFVGKGKGSGVFVLRDRRDREGHGRFTGAVREAIEGGS